MKGYLNFQDACNVIGVKKSTMYNLIHANKFNGKGDTIVHMRKRWFSEQAIDKYIQNIVQANRN